MIAKILTLILTGALMTSISNANTGRGDFHTRYQGKTVDELIIDYMEKNAIPGMSLAIVQAPYITRVVGYGLADIESKRLVATHTLFNIGQITNAYTAVAIMQLKEAGKLKLDDPIGNYLADLPANWKAITIRQLLAQTSGLADFSSVSGFDYAKNYQADEVIKLIENQPLLFKAGTQMQPSGSNFYLLGLIIEKVSGLSYQDFVTKNQIERIGLKDTYFISNIKNLDNEVSNNTQPFKHSQFLNKANFINPVEAASGYEKEEKATSSSSWYATFANSGIMASAQDISLWDIGLAGDLLVKDKSDREFLYKSAHLDNGKAVPAHAGWFFPGHKGLMEIKGNTPGYSSFLSRFTAADELVCVTLLANKGDLPDLDILARKIAGAFNPKLAAPSGAAWSETMQSPYSVRQTLERITQLIQKKGGKVFAHIHHSEEAKKVNQTLESTEVLLVGNPAKGTALMQANPAFALDLPLRIMATEDSTGQVWLSFTDPAKLADEYHLPPSQAPLLQQMSNGLRSLCETAVSAQSDV